VSDAVPLVATVVAVLLLTSCGIRDQIPFPIEEQSPPSTLVLIPVPYPTSTAAPPPTKPPCDLPPVICAGGP